MEQIETERPDYCCGRCPEIVGGGYDCTCLGNPRCQLVADARQGNIENYAREVTTLFRDIQRSADAP